MPYAVTNLLQKKRFDTQSAGPILIGYRQTILVHNKDLAMELKQFMGVEVDQIQDRETQTDWESCNVSELRAELRRRKIQVSSSAYKGDLVEKLKEDDQLQKEKK